ncbi:hypothetical protein VTI74DRAFT_308 [Chaetomium olivicolor]
MDSLTIISAVGTGAGLLQFLKETGTAIDHFITQYREADSELNGIRAGLDTLSLVIETVANAFKNASAVQEEIDGRKHGAIGDKIRRLGRLEKQTAPATATDIALNRTLKELNKYLEKLNAIIKISQDRMDLGGIYKMHVKVLWGRTSGNIKKIK